jgi:hypothetical protein
MNSTSAATRYTAHQSFTRKLSLLSSVAVSRFKKAFARLTTQDFLIILYLAGLFGTNAYRAATQSITHDEALTYFWFARYPWPYMFSVYDSNHHVLHTILVKLSISIFGLSELAMRLPSLAGGLLYLVTAYRLCNLLLKKPVYFFPALGLLTLNPFILDFLVAARGYGLALGFLLWSLYHLVAYLHSSTKPPTQWRLLKASIALGVSVSANLAFLYAVAAVAAVFIVMYFFEPSLKEMDARSSIRRLTSLILAFCLPGLLLAGLINAGPISNATRANFYAGASSLVESVKSILDQSLCHARIERSGLLCGPYDHHSVVAVFFVLALIVILASSLVVAIFKKRSGIMSQTRALILLNGSFILCLAMIITAHLGFGVLYPKDRTGLFLLSLFVLCFFYTAHYLHDIWSKTALLLAPAHIVLLLVLAQHAMQFNLKYFSIWQYDAGTKTMFEIVSHQPPRDDGQSIRFGFNDLFRPSIDFYWERYQTDWIETTDDVGPASSCDYYLLYQGDENRLRRAGKNLNLLYEDRTSDARLFAAIR